MTPLKMEEVEVEGFEPPNTGTKNRGLTTWRHLKNLNREERCPLPEPFWQSLHGFPDALVVVPG